MTVGGFIGGLIITAIGFMMVWKSGWMYQNFGAIEFAEKHLHADGGTSLLYKIFGVIIIFFGILMATNLMDTFIAWAVMGIFGRSMQLK